jgi:predicted NAD/FAD-binding protein
VTGPACSATGRLDIAVVGSGVSGLSAAWLLARRHRVTLYEAQERLGGHSFTVEAPGPAGAQPVDMGFIVYNEANYPNLTALFAHLGVATRPSNMGFSVSLEDGRFEYGGDSLPAFLAQWRNLVRPRFWSMLADLVRFYREAPEQACALHGRMTSLGEFLDAQGYGAAFQDDHLLPQAAAIWSASVGQIRAYPASAFIRFCENHGLLKIVGRPQWRTVFGGAREYVAKMAAGLGEGVRVGATVAGVRRRPEGVLVREAAGPVRRFDRVVIATHADQGLALLEDADQCERRVLGAFGYARNHAVLHSDPSFLPKRRRTWSAWNYVSRDGESPCVTYWMNRLQSLPAASPLFVTLNPARAPDPASILRQEVFDHPQFDAAALNAQDDLWSLQGRGGVWWCGAYFGSGFHEDGLQAGLAVAEQLGGLRRPWTVAAESGRIRVTPAGPIMMEQAA